LLEFLNLCAGFHLLCTKGPRLFTGERWTGKLG